MSPQEVTGTGTPITGPGTPGLSINYDELRRRIAHFLGIDEDFSGWSEEIQQRVDDIIASGLRQFYNPPPVQLSRREGLAKHDWRFLKPVDSVTTSSGTGDYDLPNDFGGIEGDLTFGSETVTSAVYLVGEAQIRKKRQQSPISGRPKLAAVRAKEHDGTDVQRYEIMFWPEPNDTFTLYYRKLVQLNNLSSDNPWPVGGAAHAETILESCLAEAESYEEDTGEGLHWQRFLRRLAASVRRDRIATAPEYLGYMGPGTQNSARQGITHNPGLVRYESGF